MKNEHDKDKETLKEKAENAAHKAQAKVHEMKEDIKAKAKKVKDKIVDEAEEMKAKHQHKKSA